MKKRCFSALLLLLCLSMLLSAGALADQGETDKAPFTYQHDPRDNPKAMRDIVVNPDAVYGFSPSAAEGSTLKEYAAVFDCTDAKQVADAREQRLAYHKSMDELYDMILDMLKAGDDNETIARAVSQRRNELRLESCKDDPEGLEVLKKRNLDTYGNELGPTPESLYEKYGSWEEVLYKALGTNPGMDACLGLYDEYYYLYARQDSIVEEARAQEKAAADSTAELREAA